MIIVFLTTKYLFIYYFSLINISFVQVEIFVGSKLKLNLRK